jgi:hypothetical protein
MKKRETPRAAILAGLGLALLCSCKSSPEPSTALPQTDTATPVAPSKPAIQHERVEKAQREVDAAAEAMRQRFKGVEGLDED